MHIWEIIRPADLTRFAREVPSPRNYTLNRFLPDRTIAGIKSRASNVTRTNVAAKFRAYNAETPIGRRPIAVSVTEVTLPPIGQKLPLTEYERLLSDAVNLGTGNNGVDQATVSDVYDDTEHNVRAIRARMELARGDFLVDGKFTLTAENGLTIEADYGLLNTHIVTPATVLWSDPEALALTEEQAWVQVMVDDGGAPPEVAITSLKVRNYLLNNDEYKGAFWGGVADPPSLNVDQLAQVRSTYGLPPIVLYDTLIDVDGVSTRPIPENRFILTTDGGAVGETQWGQTAEALELIGSNAVDFTRADAPGLFAAVYKSVDPVTVWSKATGVGMPVAADLRRHLSATVIA